MENVTCVLTTFLGNRVFSVRLADAVDRCIGASKKLWFNEDAYRRHPAPRLLRGISALEGAAVAKRWLRDVSRSGTFVINGFGLAMALNAEAMVVATDTTPAMMSRMADAPGPRMVNSFVSARFRSIARRVRVWLPVSETCRHSLVEDYGVPPERCLVTRCPQSVVEPRPHEPRGEILFVGNDFARKGGRELLLVFERNLLPECRLTIVSNDRGLVEERPRSNVRVVSGLHSPTEIAEYYRAADLLVLPTQFDVYSFVICEAAAYGVPAVATRVGGVGELLDESGGVSLPPDCSPETIAETIRKALGASYAARAQTAARFSLRELGIDRFDGLVREALGTV